VPAATARKVEHFAAGGNEAGPALHPFGGRLQRVRVIQDVECNQDAGTFSMLQLSRAPATLQRAHFVCEAQAHQLI
jgi:hypothetical protein